ncbi:cytochrome P450 2U1-like [Branchiostoma floridae x Branchiostoma belcheri]
MCDLEYRDEPMLLMSWARRYGDVFMYHVGSRVVVVLNGYRTIQQALVKQADDFSSRPYMPITVQNSQKKGVIHVPYSPFWKQHRKITLLKMREIGVDKPVLDQKIAAEGKCLVQEILKKDNKPFNMTKMIQTAVSNIISTMLCGTRYEYDHPGLQIHRQRRFEFQIFPPFYAAQSLPVDQVGSGSQHGVQPNSGV